MMVGEKSTRQACSFLGTSGRGAVSACISTLKIGFGFGVFFWEAFLLVGWVGFIA